MDDYGAPFASGRAADVYDRGDGTVLRRYRTEHDVSNEAQIMSWLGRRKYPVPMVHSATGRDLVMDMVPGPTMMADIGRRPWLIGSHVRTLAELQRRLGSIGAPESLQGDPRLPAGSYKRS